MRSSIADQHSPGPHDMVIRVHEANDMMALLCRRHAWQLTRQAELPARDPVPAGEPEGQRDAAHEAYSAPLAAGVAR